MAQVLEDRPGSVAEYDAATGHSRARRTFMVDVAPKLIPRDGSLAGLPGINDPHPDIPGAIVDRVIAGVMDGLSAWSRVEILYSSDRQFQFPTPPLDPSQPGFKSWSMDFITVTTEIPIAKKIMRTVPQPNGGAPQTQTTWAYNQPDTNLKVLETRIIYRYRLALDLSSPGFPQPNWAAIGANNNKLNSISGSVYRFESGTWTQTTPTSWEGSYSWEYDGGTKAPDVVNATPVESGTIIVPPGTAGGSLFRPPFAVWQAISPTIPTPTGYPFFVYQVPYEENLNGHLALPGVV